MRTRLSMLSLLAGSVAMPASGSGLQVEPVSVTLRERAGVIWLANSGDTPMQAQVRVYRWNQGAGGETLEPSEDLIASPPMVRIPVGGRQMVRLISTGTARCEDPFRLAIDELPGPAPKSTGLRYVLHYSVPVFIAGRDCAGATPKLSWRIETGKDGARLLVENTGERHAQLAQASFTDAHGRRTELNPGLMGYVLAGSRMSFALAPQASVFAGGGAIEILVNGTRITQRLPAG
jgi:fimbrial chaperone protein